MSRTASRLIVRTLNAIAAAWLLIAMAAPASAQGVSGVVSGTVKDAQGGVIPGATITLISEARGINLESVVTNAVGDFVVPNVSADTYTIQVDMPSFKTLKRTGVGVSPGSRIVLGTLTIELGAKSEEIIVKGEAPIIQAASGEKSFTISTAAKKPGP